MKLKKKKKEETNLDEVPKIEDEGLISPGASNLQHIQLRQDNFGEGFESNNALFGMLGGHACVNQVSNCS